jgi:mRNA-degrading endonuclease RelE of RelBE toxin-antitoxin system
MSYAIIYSDEALEDLEALRPYDRNIIIEAVGRALAEEPTIPSRNRKPLQQDLPEGLLSAPEARVVWELRVREFRVFYDVEPETLVLIIRVVRKGRATTEGSLK